MTLNLIEWLEFGRTLERKMTLLLVDVGLTLAQWRLLSLLAEERASTVSALGTQLGVSKPTITVLVQDLRRAGLVHSTPNPTDRRSARLTLTAVACKRLAVAQADMAALERALSPSLPRATLKALQVVSPSSLHEPGVPRKQIPRRRRIKDQEKLS